MVVFAIIFIPTIVLLLVFAAIWSPKYEGAIPAASVASTKQVAQQSSPEVTPQVGVKWPAETSPTSNGLVQLQLKPSFSQQLPSPEDAQRALAMHNEFLKNSQQK